MPRDQAIVQTTDRYENWLAILDTYGVQFLILDTRRDDDLLRSVRLHPDWTVDFQDGESILFARNRPLDSTQVAA
jgi:hypothetical protein